MKEKSLDELKEEKWELEARMDARNERIMIEDLKNGDLK